MTFDLNASMQDALAATRAGDLNEATRLIQTALGNTHHVTPKPEPAPANALRLTRSRIDRTAETIEPKPTARGDGESGAVRVESRTFRNGSGQRAYRLSLPAGEVRGLVLMLHGCTQTPEDFAKGTGMDAAAHAQGFAVAWPGQSHGANPNRCWSWFEPAHQKRGAGEPEVLAGIVRALVDEFALERAPVLVAGLSAGGAMAAVLAEGYPELFTAVGVHSGLACGSASDVASAFAAMRGKRRSRKEGTGPVPCLIVHGSADQTVHPDNAEALSDWAGLGGLSLNEHRETHGGRGVVRTVGRGANGRVRVERWIVDGAGHAWSGGHPSGSYTDRNGPDATAEMLRFLADVAE